MSDTASEIARLRAALAAETARAEAAESELVQVRATVSFSEAVIKELEIAKLRRDKYGVSSERTARLLDQLELQLEELEATATEDALAAEQAASDTATVRSFTRRKPARKQFPDHLPRERVVVEAPGRCDCCGSDRIVKMGEDCEAGKAIFQRTIAPPNDTLEVHPARSTRGSARSPLKPSPGRFVASGETGFTPDGSREIYLPGLRE